MINSREDKPFNGMALRSNARKAAVTCQAVGIALSPFLSLQPVLAQVTPSGTVPRAETTNTTIIPTDVVPLAGAQERTNFGENLQLRIMQRLPARFYFSTSFELSDRYETNPFQFPTKRELLKQLPPPQVLRVLDAFNQARINDIIGLVNNDDTVFRLLPNVSGGWTLDPHTRLFCNYFMIRDQLAHNIRLNTIIHSLGAGIQHDFPIGQKGSLQLEMQGRELWQLHQQSVFDFLPGATFSYILNPKTVLFVNSLVQMRGKAFFQAPTKEIDPFYTWGGLHQRNGWTFTASTTFVQNFREPFRGNATIPRNNYVFICDFEIARRILKEYPGLQAFVRIEPIYNFKSDDTPGLAGMDFRAFFGFRFAMAKPALTATLEQIRQQLEETETTTPKQTKPGTKPSAYDFPQPHELIAHNPQPIHGFLAKAGLEETAINPDGEQPVLIADNQTSQSPAAGQEISEQPPAAQDMSSSAEMAQSASAPVSEETQSQPQGTIAEQIAEEETAPTPAAETAVAETPVAETPAAETPAAEQPIANTAPRPLTRVLKPKVGTAVKVASRAKVKPAPGIPNIASKQVAIDDLPAPASGQKATAGVALDQLNDSLDTVNEPDTSTAIPQPIQIQKVSHPGMVAAIPIAMLPGLPATKVAVPAPKAPQLGKNAAVILPPTRKAATGHAQHLPGVSRLAARQDGPLPPSSPKHSVATTAALPPQSISTTGGTPAFSPSPLNRSESGAEMPDLAQISKSDSSQIQPVPLTQMRSGTAPAPALPTMANNFIPATVRKNITAATQKASGSSGVSLDELHKSQVAVNQPDTSTAIPQPRQVQNVSRPEMPIPIAMLPGLPAANVAVPAPKAPQLGKNAALMLPPTRKAETGQVQHLPGVSRLAAGQTGPLPPSSPKHSIGTTAPALSPQSIGAAAGVPAFSPSPLNRSESPAAVPDVAQISKSASAQIQPVPLSQTRKGSVQAPAPVLPAMADNFIPARIRENITAATANAPETVAKPQPEKVPPRTSASDNGTSDRLEGKPLAPIIAKIDPKYFTQPEARQAQTNLGKNIESKVPAQLDSKPAQPAVAQAPAQKLTLQAETRPAQPVVAQAAETKIPVPAETKQTQVVGGAREPRQQPSATPAPAAISKSDRPVVATTAATITKHAPSMKSNAVADGTQVARMPESAAAPPAIATVPRPQFEIHIPTPQVRTTPARTTRNDTVQVPLAVSDLGDDIASPRLALLAFNSAPPPVIDDEVTPAEPERSAPADERATIFVPARTKAEELSPEKNKAAYSSMNKKLGKQDTNSDSMRLVPPLPSLGSNKKNPFKDLDIKPPVIMVH